MKYHLRSVRLSPQDPVQMAPLGSSLGRGSSAEYSPGSTGSIQVSAQFLCFSLAAVAVIKTSMGVVKGCYSKAGKGVGDFLPLICTFPLDPELVLSVLL